MQAFAVFSDEFSWRLTQALLHFLWQGSVIGLAAWLLDRVLRRVSSSTPYSLHLSALLVMGACLPVTFALVGGSDTLRNAREVALDAHGADAVAKLSTLYPSEVELSQPLTASRGRHSTMAGQVNELPLDSVVAANAVVQDQVPATLADISDGATFTEPATAHWGLASLMRYSPFIAAAYVIGVLLMTARLTAALRGVQRLRRVSTPLDDGQLLAIVKDLARRIGLRAAPAVAYCREVSVPIVLGVVKPLIVLPAAIACGMPPDQLEALLMHELAHVRRFDPLVNLVQRLIEAALFFHPAVWYVSRRVGIERERASDDLVLAIGVSPLTYADALVRMAEISLSLRQPGWAATTLAASGDRPTEFRRRVLRLLSGDAPQVRVSPWGVLLLSLALVIGAAAPMLVHAWPVPREASDDAQTVQDVERIGRRIDNFALHDYLGTEHQLKEFADSRLVVVAFLGTECPLAQRYGPRLAQLADEYKERGVALIGINSNRQDTPTEIGHYVRQHGIKFPMLKDPGNLIADQFGAVRTPEVFVLDAERIVRYWGGIDDQFGVGYMRPNATQQFLVAAIDELLAGKPVSRTESASVGCYIGRVTRKAPAGEITYTNQVSRILQRRCIECHRDGGIAPFAMSSYAEVAGWGETIREVVKDQRMPPWHADPKYGHFSNDSRLPPEEQRLLCAWVENGMPEGSPADLPAPARFVDGWSLGQPDLVVAMPEAFTVAPDGVIPYQYITVDPGFTEGKWVRASEVRPGVRSVVHHVIVFVNPPGGDPILQERGVGFETVGGYVPGAPPMQLEEGLARYVPPGSTFVFQMHYMPDGKTQHDRTRIGLYFADPASVRRTMQTAVAANLDFEIPPHAAAHQVEASVRLDFDTEVHALMPHMHFRGKSFRFTAIYPNGAREILLDVPRYDFNWQHAYRLAQPKVLPEGTLLKCVALFDNSRDNPSNPDPASPVKWGEQSWEEMMIGYLDAVYLNQGLTRPEPNITPLSNGNYLVHFAYRPNRPVRSVNLAGTFNEWNTSSHPLADPDGDGEYTADVEMKSGPCRYKFVVDGNYWTHDPASRILTGFFHESFFVAGNDSTGKPAS